MIKPRLFLCGGSDLDKYSCPKEERHTVVLSTHGSAANVNIRLEDVAKVFSQHLEPRLQDLLEIAAYVYTADCATTRGGAWMDQEATEPWGRDFRFVIPVRDLSFWADANNKDSLCQVLNLLSDDHYEFDFHAMDGEVPQQTYLEYGDADDWPFYDCEWATMFSGGLDSLAGAVEAASNGERLVLVSHRPVSTQSKRQSELFAALKSQFRIPMIHVPVWINKDESKGREPSQRTRSFLYSALGAIVASSVRAGGVRFYENGVVSLNWPVADEVLRARASRTTHPSTLARFSDFYGSVLGRNLTVDNPYVFMTKSEVVARIQQCGGSELIGRTCSCAHQGLFQSKTQWHCGACSQCIDRRFAICANGLEQFDSADDYKIDVFVGPRSEGYDRNMAVNYARHGIELGQMNEQHMASVFNLELGRAVREFEKRKDAALRFVEMHLRHGQTVTQVLATKLRECGTDLINGNLDKTSLLAMVAGQKHQHTSWQVYAARIVGLLATGLPLAYKKEKPKNEPRLQEVCDAILRAHDNDLVREFPYMRWGSIGTKPDWSAEELSLWVELKYVRKKEDIRPITEAIAADITKYGDSGRHVLYVVYDPFHLITDDAEFSSPVERRAGMEMRFIR